VVNILKGKWTKELRWLWRTSNGLRGQSLLNALTSILAVGLDFAFIAATKLAIDIATGRHGGLSLRWAAVLLIAIMASRIMIAFASRWIAAILGVRSQNLMQLRLFRHIMQCEWHGMERKHSGDVLNRLERDVKDVTDVITDTMPSVLGVIVRFCGAFVFLYSMDQHLACLLVFIAPIFIALSKIYIKRMRRITRNIRHTDSQIQSILQESVQHRVVLKTLEQSETMVDRLDLAQQTLRGYIKERTLFSSTSGTLLTAGFSLGYLVTFLWGANRLQEGTITYGTMLAFIQLVGQIQGPFREMTRYIPVIINSLTASERLMELQEAPLETDGDALLFHEEVGIRLDNVSFTYEGAHHPVLNHFSYDFPPGSTTAVLGETGAGKTTLLRLILALLKANDGSIEFYDNSGYSVAASPQTRCNLVYVPQGNTLFSGTIRDNLLLGKPDATEDEMRDVLKTACADFVLESPTGLDTPCGELGAGLSEGQAQRIAIARALLRTGNILLLDEATSALDPETESQLLRNLHDRVSSHQTIICITHRPAVVEYCTQELRLKDIS